MKYLYAPWRHDYVNNCPEKPKEPLKNNCVFCHQFDQNNDEKYYIIKRFSYSAVMLNYYPYKAGHIMILPLEHKGMLTDLDAKTRAQIMEVTSASIPILEKTLNAQGFNIGINLGEAGGGGIPAHLHVHVLPRWKGDTNFFETIGEMRLISSNMDKVYHLLREGFAALTI